MQNKDKNLSRWKRLFIFLIPIHFKQTKLFQKFIVNCPQTKPKIAGGANKQIAKGVEENQLIGFKTVAKPAISTEKTKAKKMDNAYPNP